MTKRILALDYARGFTVLCIPAIHSVMVYSNHSVYKSIFGYALTFIAEGPGAQLFMMIMGIAFTFKQKHEWPLVIKRSLLLLVAGYVLNAVKFIFPFILGGLPAGAQRDLQLIPGHEIFLLLLLGDILHFAAIAMIVIAAVYRLTNYWFWSAVISGVVMIIAPLLYDQCNQYAISLFTGQPPRVFFPVLPWIVYPLIGLTLGYLIKRNQFQTFHVLPWIGITLLSCGIWITFVIRQISPVGFYRTYAGETIAHIGVVFIVLTFWKWIAATVKPNAFLNLLEQCSRHITVIYIVQWILICWSLPFVGYQVLGTFSSVMIAVFMTVMTWILSEVYLTIKESYGNKKSI